MVSYTEDLYIRDVEYIYNNILEPKSMKEINKLEESLKRALKYKDCFLRDKENFTYHFKNIENIRNIFKEKIKQNILNCQATIEVNQNRIKEFEKQLKE